MPHLVDVRRSDQSVQDESVRIKAEDQLEAKNAVADALSTADAPRRSSAAPQDSAPAPQEPAPAAPAVESAPATASAPAPPAAPDAPSDAAPPIKIVTTPADDPADAKEAADASVAAGDATKEEENVSPSRRKPSEADEAAALALQAFLFVAQPDTARNQSPLQILTAEVEKEKEQEEERAGTDAPIDGEALPRAFEVQFDSVTDAAQVALLLAPDGVLSHEDLCVFIKHWGRLRGAQESYAVGKNWKRSLRNLMKKIPTFVSPSEDTWTLANPSAPPPAIFADSKRVTVSVASLRKIFPPISSSPVPPRPGALTSAPRPKRQSNDLGAPPPPKKEREAPERDSSMNENGDEGGSSAADVKMKQEEEGAEPEQKSTPTRPRGRVSKAEMRELFENVSSPLVKANVRAIVNENTYAKLSAEERASLEKMLPSPDRNPEALIGILRGRNTFFNDSIAMYQNMLKSGAFDPFYADQRSMMRERRARERDPWKAANFEEHWGEQLLKKLWENRPDAPAQDGAAPAAAVELPPLPSAGIPTPPVPALALDDSHEKEQRERDKKRAHRKKEARPRPAAAAADAANGAAGAEPMEEKEKWLACDQCDQWVVAAQDGITDITPYDESLTPNPLRYLCPICRGEERERAAKRAARKEVSGSLSTSSGGGGGGGNGNGNISNKRSRTDEASSHSDHHPPARVARARGGEDEEEIELRS